MEQTKATLKDIMENKVKEVLGMKVKLEADAKVSKSLGPITSEDVDD